jgi:hypothetical protein
MWIAPKNVTGRSAASPGSLAVSFACVAAGIFPFVALTAGLYLASGGVIAASRGRACQPHDHVPRPMMYSAIAPERAVHGYRPVVPGQPVQWSSTRLKRSATPVSEWRAIAASGASREFPSQSATADRFRQHTI